MVDVNDVAIASDLLLKYEEEYLQNFPCPSCGEKQIISVISISKQNVVEQFLSKLFKEKNLNTEKWYECQHCGWKEKILPVA